MICYPYVMPFVVLSGNSEFKKVHLVATSTVIFLQFLYGYIKGT